MSTRDYLEKDYYQVLGVSKDASADEIKRAYRKLARQYHPDHNTGDAAAETRFKEVGEAYGVLSDAAKRQEYDEARTLFGSGGFRYPGAGGGAGGPGGPGFSFDFNDLFGGGAPGTGGGTAGAGGLGDIFGGLFGGGTRRQAGRRGADIESEVTLAFRDAADGSTVPIRMTSEASCPACHGTGARAGTTPRVCPTCQGSGTTSRGQGAFAFSEPCRDCRGRGLVVDDPCPECHGSGRATSTRTMQVRLPAGVSDGQRVRLKGKGAAGERGGPPGDLYVLVHVSPHPVFGRTGDNLTVTVPVGFDEAVLGAEIEVPTLAGGTVRLRLPAGTANGRTFRVRGKGIRRKDGTTGDLLVTVEVQVPATLDDATRSAVEALREARLADGAADPRAALLAKARSA
ncbi:MAG: molecular chaperone DnaJ [Actinomycetales bacterium]